LQALVLLPGHQLPDQGWAKEPGQEGNEGESEHDQQTDEHGEVPRFHE
jgi:hypothetical protein